MKKRWIVILFSFFSLCVWAQDQPVAELEESMNLIEKAWSYSIDVAPVFNYYVSDENIEDLRQLCLNNRDKLDSIYFFSKEAEYRTSDAVNAASVVQLNKIEKQTTKIMDYLQEAETDFTNSINNIDLLLDENDPEIIYMHLYDAEDYFINARQQIKKAEKEIEKAIKDLQKIK